MTAESILAALEGHEPTGDYDGVVQYCMCGWDCSMSGGDYRDHVADILTEG